MKNQTVQEIQTAALWKQEAQRNELWVNVRTALHLRHGQYLSEVVTLPSGGLIAGVTGISGDGLQWTTVLDGRSDHSYYSSDALAMLALISRRREDDPNVTRNAVRYAARVLALSQD